MRIKGGNEYKVLSGTAFDKCKLIYESREIGLLAKEKEVIFAGVRWVQILGLCQRK